MSKTNLKTENRKNTVKDTFSMLNSYFTAFQAFFLHSTASAPSCFFAEPPGKLAEVSDIM
jgi:hypothetical protein